jgi:hypothetical protein
MVFGDMPIGAWLLMHASCIRWSMEAGLLLMVLWRSEPHVRGEKLLVIPANKLEVRPPNQEVVASEDEARYVVLLLSCSHQEVEAWIGRSRVCFVLHGGVVLLQFLELLNGGD